MNPQVVRELQRNTAAPVRDWRKGFGAFTFVISALSGAAVVLFGIPEKDFKGRDHVLSGLQRAIKRRRDEFFGVPTTETTSKPSKAEVSSGASTTAATTPSS